MSTEEITATEAARRLGVTDKTLRKWIAQGKIAARRISETRLALSADDVEALASERAQETGAPDLRAMQERLDAIDARLQRIEALLETVMLRAEMRERELQDEQPYKQAPPSVRLIRDRPRNTVEQESVTPTVGVPAGSIHMNDLAREIGIARPTLAGHVKSGKYRVISRAKANRPHEADHYFSPEEAARVRSDYRER